MKFYCHLRVYYANGCQGLSVMFRSIVPQLCSFLFISLMYVNSLNALHRWLLYDNNWCYLITKAEMIWLLYYMSDSLDRKSYSLLLLSYLHLSHLIITIILPVLPYIHLFIPLPYIAPYLLPSAATSSGAKGHTSFGERGCGCAHRKGGIHITPRLLHLHHPSSPQPPT